MALSRPRLNRIGTIVAYLLLGVAGTVVTALGILYLSQPIQRLIYGLFYLQIGPSSATQAAILTHFLVAGFAGLSVVLLTGDYLSDRLQHRVILAKGIGILSGFLLLFLLVALAGVAAFLTALIVLTVALVTVLSLMRYRYDVQSGGITAFVGGVPVLLVLLVLAGFGLGWGWGYVMTAQEIPASAVNGTADTTLEEFPQIRADLLAGDCETDINGRRTCRLYLRGYEHEVDAARFMARHGVRCPYQNTPSGPSESFVARDNESYYRIYCTPHGD